MMMGYMPFGGWNLLEGGDFKNSRLRYAATRRKKGDFPMFAKAMMFVGMLLVSSFSVSATASTEEETVAALKRQIVALQSENRQLRATNRKLQIGIDLRDEQKVSRVYVHRYFAENKTLSQVVQTLSKQHKQQLATLTARVDKLESESVGVAKRSMTDPNQIALLAGMMFTVLVLGVFGGIIIWLARMLSASRKSEHQLLRNSLSQAFDSEKAQEGPLHDEYQLCFAFSGPAASTEEMNVSEAPGSATIDEWLRQNGASERKQTAPEHLLNGHMAHSSAPADHSPPGAIPVSDSHAAEGLVPQLQGSGEQHIRDSCMQYEVPEDFASAEDPLAAPYDQSGRETTAKLPWKRLQAEHTHPSAPSSSRFFLRGLRWRFHLIGSSVKSSIPSLGNKRAAARWEKFLRTQQRGISISDRIMIARRETEFLASQHGQPP